jgi:hypothetical protein
VTIDLVVEAGGSDQVRPRHAADVELRAVRDRCRCV